MKRTWKSITAGIVLILIGGSTLLTRILLHFDVDWSTDIFFWFALVIGIVPLIGGYFALRRRVWGLALAGAICVMILWFEGMLTALSWEYALAFGIFAILLFVDVPLAILAIVLLALSKREFS